MLIIKLHSSLCYSILCWLFPDKSYFSDFIFLWKYIFMSVFPTCSMECFILQWVGDVLFLLWFWVHVLQLLTELVPALWKFLLSILNPPSYQQSSLLLQLLCSFLSWYAFSGVWGHLLISGLIKNESNAAWRLLKQCLPLMPIPIYPFCSLFWSITYPLAASG